MISVFAMIILIFLSILPYLESEVTSLHSPESVELIRHLEQAYCSSINDGDRVEKRTCNEAESRICNAGRCVSACSERSMAHCTCPGVSATGDVRDRCSICCGSATSFCGPAASYRIYGPGKMPWARNSDVDGCSRPESDGRGGGDSDFEALPPLCDDDEDGKICNIVYSSGLVEVPQICVSGMCVTPRCELLTPEATSVACQCPEARYAKYPICCRESEEPRPGSGSGDCLPFQHWLISSDARRSYVATLSGESGGNDDSPGGGGSSLVLVGASASSGGAGLWQSCGKKRDREKTNGMRCGPAHVCTEAKCVHVCGNPAKECFCGPGTTTECHICCIVWGRCESATLNNDKEYRRWRRQVRSPTLLRVYRSTQIKKRLKYNNNNYYNNNKNNNTINTNGDSRHSYSQENSESFSKASPKEQPRNYDLPHNAKINVFLKFNNVNLSSTNSQHQYKHVQTRAVAGNKIWLRHPHSDEIPQQISSSPFIRTVGTPCNFDQGVCSDEGKCDLVPNSPTLKFCSREGSQCDVDSICRSGKCVHVCGSAMKACICSPESRKECHVCCLRNGKCVSMSSSSDKRKQRHPDTTHQSVTYQIDDYYVGTQQRAKRDTEPDWIHMSEREILIQLLKEKQRLSAPSKPLLFFQKENVTDAPPTRAPVAVSLYRSPGTPCNYSFGSCMPNGECEEVRHHPLKVCISNPDCSPDGVCNAAEGRCEHICGRKEDTCICSPGSGLECHICCISGEGGANYIKSCVPGSIARGLDGATFHRPVGTPCNYTYGVCTSAGECGRVMDRPSDYCSVDGESCAAHRVCMAQKCVHVCGAPELECVCTPQSGSECHVCCRSEQDSQLCESIYDGRTPTLLRELGTSCNYTYGTCGSNGACLSLQDHPSLGICHPEENEGVQCGDKHWCKDRKCVHVCGAAGSVNECLCGEHSGTECHVCCLNEARACVSVYNVSNTSQKFLVRPSGTSCNFTFGACDNTGACIGRASHPAFSVCHDPATEGEACDSEGGGSRACKNQKCEHVCGSADRQCQCTPHSRQECHVCCLTDEGVCESIYDASSPHLLLPQGTTCNFTYGVCDSKGTCEPVRSHPSAGTACITPENNNAPCGPGRVCKGAACTHVCGHKSRVCKCKQGTRQQCHLCCRKMDKHSGKTVCVSAYEDPDYKPFRYEELLVAPGAPCTTILELPDVTEGGDTVPATEPSVPGVCTAEGSCLGSKEFCLRNDTRNKQCDTGSYCDKSRECSHVCGSTKFQCDCPVSSGHECHICCLASSGADIAEDFVDQVTGDSCVSAYRHGYPFLIQKVGKDCDGASGQCNDEGKCGPRIVVEMDDGAILRRSPNSVTFGAAVLLTIYAYKLY